jgi:hypothetical protein
MSGDTPDDPMNVDGDYTREETNSSRIPDFTRTTGNKLTRASVGIDEGYQVDTKKAVYILV